MSPQQRAEALRLANSLDHMFAGWQGDVPAAAALLRSLAAEPERKPLTGEQLRNIVREVREVTRLRLVYYWAETVDFARAVEQAHRIGD